VLLAGGTTIRTTWWRLAVLVVVAVPAAALSISGLYLSVVSGVQGSPVLMLAFLVVLCALLTPHIVLVASIGRRLLPALLGVAAVGLVGVAVTTSGYTAAQPRPDTAAYLLNAATGQAFWATTDRDLDEYTRQLLQDPVSRALDDLIGAGGSSTLLSSPAPIAELQPPRLVVQAQQVEGDLRTLSVHIQSPRGGWRALVFPGEGTDLVAASFQGASPAALKDGTITVVGVPPEGIDFQLTVRAREQATLVVVDQTMDLPALPGVPPRPAFFMTAPVPEDFRGYPTFVSTQVTVP
jgi:hypothetical protein